MVFEGSHDFVFVEIGDPVEESIQVASRISVEGLAGRINGNVIVDKLYFISILLKSIYHEVFLVPTSVYSYPSK